MKRMIIVALAVLGSAAAFAQTGPAGALKTSDVGIDTNGVCWVRGPANALVRVAPKLGAPVPIASATDVLPAGTWLVVSAGTATVIVSDGSAVTGVATGNAYPL